MVLVHGMVSLVFSDTICIPDQFIVGTSSFQVEVSAECSGYEGVGLIAVFACVALSDLPPRLRLPASISARAAGDGPHLAGQRFPHCALIAIGTWGYPEFAAGAFHSLAGSLLFVLIAFWPDHPGSPNELLLHSRDRTEGPPRRTRLRLSMPAMAVTATAMVAGNTSPGFDRYYAARVIVATSRSS